MFKREKLREWSGIALVGAGVAGTLLPVVPGFALIAAGVAVLGPDHFLVRRARAWLEKKGLLKTKPCDEKVESVRSNQ